MAATRSGAALINTHVASDAALMASGSAMGKCGSAESRRCQLAPLISTKQSGANRHMTTAASVFGNVEVKPRLYKDV